MNKKYYVLYQLGHKPLAVGESPEAVLTEAEKIGFRFRQYELAKKPELQGQVGMYLCEGYPDEAYDEWAPPHESEWIPIEVSRTVKMGPGTDPNQEMAVPTDVRGHLLKAFNRWFLTVFTPGCFAQPDRFKELFGQDVPNEELIENVGIIYTAWYAGGCAGVKEWGYTPDLEQLELPGTSPFDVVRQTLQGIRPPS